MQQRGRYLKDTHFFLSRFFPLLILVEEFVFKGNIFFFETFFCKNRNISGHPVICQTEILVTSVNRKFCLVDTLINRDVLKIVTDSRY